MSNSRRQHAFTLVELLTVVGIIAVLMSVLIPVTARAMENARRTRCQSNVRQIVQALLIYALEHNHNLPRTVYDEKKKLLLDTAGDNVVDSFGNKGYVGENNVPASYFYLLKVQKLPPALFVCPSTMATPGYANGNPQQASNWEDIPGNLSYSFATPFPTAAAVANGFVWKDKLANGFALVADMNPGTRGGSNPPNNVVGPSHSATYKQMRAANSNNHRNQGQNVGYTDGHVEFQTSPYCGSYRSTGFRDHIFAAGPGDNGTCDETALPTDHFDCVLLPTDDPGGK